MSEPELDQDCRAPVEIHSNFQLRNNAPMPTDSPPARYSLLLVESMLILITIAIVTDKWSCTK